MHSVTQLFKRRIIVALASGLFVSLPASADDIDVYTSQLAGQIKPNILLVLDYSGSMQEDVAGNSTSVDADRKITILKDAVDDLMTKHKDRINLGLGSLYDNRPSGVRWPINDLTVDPHSVDPDIPVGSYTMQQVINSQLNQRGANGSTNTVGALADAVLYFQGGPVTHSDASLSNSWSHKPDQWDTTTESYRGGNAYSALPVSYTPTDAFSETGGDGSVTGWCRNYAYYDASATNQCADKTTTSCWLYPATSYTYDHDDNDSTPEILVETDGYEGCNYSTSASWTQPNYNSPIAHECQKNYMILISDGLPTERYTGATLDTVLGSSHSTCEDLSSSIFGDSSQTFGNCGPEILHKLATEDQVVGVPDSKVKSYTIGFSVSGTGKAYLEKLAAAGTGEYYQANDDKQLSEALGLLLDDILEGSENFAELSIDLDKASFSHDNRAYFSLFNPSTKRAWDGNVKGYFLDQSGLVDINGAPAITTVDGSIQFDENAQSFWSDAADGNEVVEGGAAEQMTAAGRNLYTFTGTTISGIGEDLTTAVNALDKSNSYVTDAMLNNPGDRNALLDWVQTAPMGAPLHSKAITANYPGKRVVYTVTNQGFLHAIDATKPVSASTPDATGGEELFAFMPKELLANLQDIQQNVPNSGGHIYGLDGQITPIHGDTNSNGIVETGESLVLVFGMRRGGKSYYAVDVSNYNSPKLLWQIDGGVAPFQHLAQSWSRMSLVTVKTSSGSKQVLMFAGGYDADKVDGTDGRVVAMGNAIYMIDLDGTHVWSVSGDDKTDMTYSIPSDLTVIDTNADGMADRVYVGDVGSQIWRVDFNEVDSGSFAVTEFADLNDTHNQPFFYAPSVAMNRSANGDYLSVSVASGNRTNPLQDDSEHWIYMLRDEDTQAGAPSGSFDEIVETDLHDATTNRIASADDTVSSTAYDELRDGRGWRIKLDEGEKALSTVVSFEGNLMATTYTPNTDTSASSVCEYVSTGKLYIMDLTDGRPVKYLSDGTSITDGLLASDRVTPLNGSGIPSSPVVVFPKGSSQVNIIVDKETISTVSQRLSRVFWHAK